MFYTAIFLSAFAAQCSGSSCTMRAPVTQAPVYRQAPYVQQVPVYWQAPHIQQAPYVQQAPIRRRLFFKRWSH